MSDIRKLLEAVDRYQFAGEPEQKPGDQVRGTEVAKPKKGKHPFQGRLVGANESILKELEQELNSPGRSDSRKLMQEYREFVREYGGVGGTGAAPQNPQGTTGTATDPKQQQAQKDLTAITKNLQAVKPAVVSQGGSSMNPTQAIQTLGKVSATPNVQLSNKDQAEISKFAPAIANILKNPQAASQFKQLIGKAGTTDQQQDQAVAKQTKSAQQQKTTTQQPAAGART